MRLYIIPKKFNFRSITPPSSSNALFYSWLHHSDATVGRVEASDDEVEDSNKLVLQVILSEPTLGKFTAKFGDSVAITESQDFNV